MFKIFFYTQKKGALSEANKAPELTTQNEENHNADTTCVFKIKQIMCQLHISAYQHFQMPDITAI